MKEQKIVGAQMVMYSQKWGYANARRQGNTTGPRQGNFYASAFHAYTNNGNGKFERMMSK